MGTARLRVQGLGNGTEWEPGLLHSAEGLGLFWVFKVLPSQN